MKEPALGIIQWQTESPSPGMVMDIAERSVKFIQISEPLVLHLCSAM